MVMKRLLLTAGLLVTNSFVSTIRAEGIYCQELAAFKAREDMQAIFDKEMHDGLRSIQQDIYICKELSFSQRLIRGIFLAHDVIVVTPDSMPALYAYVDMLCKNASISMPIIFITRKKTMFNAFAAKMFASTGGILIGQKLLRKTTDAELEGIVAHEIGHIKHNHVNKRLGLVGINFGISALLATYFTGITDVKTVNFWRVMLCALSVSSFVSQLIISKTFEKEADTFACESGKAEGLIEFFEDLQKKEQIHEDEFIATEKVLKESKPHIAGISYFGLLLRYCIAKNEHENNKWWRDVYSNTPLGAHPSHEARIASAQEYLAKQQQHA